jgi:hypothetical protein
MNSALKNFVINHWLKPVAWLVASDWFCKAVLSLCREIFGA